MSVKADYRPDIDGLRAIAVISVIVYHLNPSWLPGGFVGVDIFFVISGYLITSIVRREVDRGSFTLSRFYARRIARICPALFATIAGTMLAGQFILTPEDTLELAKSAVAALASAANVFFVYGVETGYSAESSWTRPLLHLWSLGVEEQFYLIWPICLLLATRLLNQRVVPVALAACIAALIVLSQNLSVSAPDFGYYMLPSRAWELLVGALISYYPSSRRLGRVASLFLGLLGLGLIAGSLLLLSDSNIFPGFAAVPPVFGSAFVIVAGRDENPVRSALSAPYLVGVGLISYSLYLWHWPVLAYLRYAYIEITPLVGAATAVAILGLAVLCYRYVERPFRHAKLPFRTTFTRLFAAPTIALAVVAAAFIATGGYGGYSWNSAYAADIRQAAMYARRAGGSKYVCQVEQATAELLQDPRCVVNGNEGNARALLWGDSHAAHMVGFFAELSKSQPNFSFRNAAHGSCPPFVTDVGKFSREPYTKSCEAFVEYIKPALKEYDTVILAAAWQRYLRDDAADALLGETIRAITASGAKAVVVGALPQFLQFDGDCAFKAAKLSIDCSARFLGTETEGLARANARVKAVVNQTPGAVFLDFSHMLCPTAGCSPFFEGAQVYADSEHLSYHGSRLLGAAVAKGTREVAEGLLD